MKIALIAGCGRPVQPNREDRPFIHDLWSGEEERDLGARVLRHWSEPVHRVWPSMLSAEAGRNRAGVGLFRISRAHHLGDG